MSEHVMIVASDGVADLTPVAKFMAARRLRLQAEADRIEAVKARGHVPEVCGDAIPDAPARGAIRVFQPMRLFPDGENDWKARPSCYRVRSAMQRADVFDVMMAKAASNGKPAPFTRAGGGWALLPGFGGASRLRRYPVLICRGAPQRRW